MAYYITSFEIRDGWRAAETADQRLKWARMHWQAQSEAINATAEDAAASLGMKAGTYRAFERPAGSSKSISLGHQEAIRFAKKFGVSWKWLLIGEGTPFDEELPEPQQRLIKLMKSMDEERQTALVNMIETFVSQKAS